MAVKTIEKFRTDKITGAGVANISEKIREARLRWWDELYPIFLGFLDVFNFAKPLMQTGEMEVRGHRKI